MWEEPPRSPGGGLGTLEPCPQLSVGVHAVPEEVLDVLSPDGCRPPGRRGARGGGPRYAHGLCGGVYLPAPRGAGLRGAPPAPQEPVQLLQPDGVVDLPDRVQGALPQDPPQIPRGLRAGLPGGEPRERRLGARQIPVPEVLQGAEGGALGGPRLPPDAVRPYLLE